MQFWVVIPQSEYYNEQEPQLHRCLSISTVTISISQSRKMALKIWPIAILDICPLKIPCEKESLLNSVVPCLNSIICATYKSKWMHTAHVAEDRASSIALYTCVCLRE